MAVDSRELWVMAGQGSGDPESDKFKCAVCEVPGVSVTVVKGDECRGTLYSCGLEQRNPGKMELE